MGGAGSDPILFGHPSATQRTPGEHSSKGPQAQPQAGVPDRGPGGECSTLSSESGLVAAEAGHGAYLNDTPGVEGSALPYSTKGPGVDGSALSPARPPPLAHSPPSAHARPAHPPSSLASIGGAEYLASPSPSSPSPSSPPPHSGGPTALAVNNAVPTLLRGGGTTSTGVDDGCGVCGGSTAAHADGCGGSGRDGDGSQRDGDAPDQASVTGRGGARADPRTTNASTAEPAASAGGDGTDGAHQSRGPASQASAADSCVDPQAAISTTCATSQPPSPLLDVPLTGSGVTTNASTAEPAASASGDGTDGAHQSRGPARQASAADGCADPHTAISKAVPQTTTDHHRPPVEAPPPTPPPLSLRPLPAATALTALTNRADLLAKSPRLTALPTRMMRSRRRAP